jgi:hypothetical protein
MRPFCSDDADMRFPRQMICRLSSELGNTKAAATPNRIRWEVFYEKMERLGGYDD